MKRGAFVALCLHPTVSPHRNLDYLSKPRWLAGERIQISHEHHIGRIHQHSAPGWEFVIDVQIKLLHPTKGVRVNSPQGAIPDFCRYALGTFGSSGCVSTCIPGTIN